MQQMRGGFSSEIEKLREELLNFASLIELELDFAEEDVEFADRGQFGALLDRIEFVLKRLIDSFAVGNVIKNGIPVAIVGEPNVGKSTLLNALLNEERAIVSDIAGTTRDTIEDELVINGIGFRFIDTAGIRETQDVVESIGIQKTFEKIGQAQVVIYLIDGGQLAESGTDKVRVELEKIKNQYPQKPLVVLVNKKDKLSENQIDNIKNELRAAQTLLFVSAKQKEGVDALKEQLLSFVNTGALRNNETIVTNSRHYDALLKALEEIEKVKWGLQSGLPADLMAIDIREALYQFGLITGQVTNDEYLDIYLLTSVSGSDVVQVMEIITFGGQVLPKRIKVDNWSEFINKILDKWAYEHGIELDFSRPGNLPTIRLSRASTGFVQR